MRATALGVTASAVVLDGVIGVMRAGALTAPIMTWCAVVAVAVAAGGSTGLVAGFGAGVVLDLLAGPASPAGVHALVGLAVGAGAAALRPHAMGAVGAGAAVGAPCVAIAVAATLGLQAMPVVTARVPGEVVVAGLLAGWTACPIVVRFLRGPLHERPRAT